LLGDIIKAVQVCGQEERTSGERSSTGWESCRTLLTRRQFAGVVSNQSFRELKADRTKTWAKRFRASCHNRWMQEFRQEARARDLGAKRFSQNTFNQRPA